MTEGRRSRSMCARSLQDGPRPIAAGPGPAGWVTWLRDYWTLTKPEVNLLVLVSTLAGFDLAWRGPMNWKLLLEALLGTLLVASGTGTLNQYLERRSDGLMRRTARRPLPSGRMNSKSALIYGLLLALGGGWLLWNRVNPLTSILALLTLASYLLLYTPLKRRTPWCTWVGALPGAMPPVIGWAAARGTLSAEAGALYAILFAWQFPHLLGIAWIYREDYSRAGLRMLPGSDVEGQATVRQIMVFLLALVPLSLIPALAGETGRFYLIGALTLTLGFIAYGVRLVRARTNRLARQLVLASVTYLPALLGLMMLDKGRP